MAASAAERPGQRRATQSLVGTIQYCIRHPSLLARELAWRWLFGIPAMAIVLRECLRIFAMVPQTTLQRLESVMYDPAQAAPVVVVLAETLLPPVRSVLAWLLPLLLLTWAVVSGLGRWFVFRRLSQIRPDLLPGAAKTADAVRLILFQTLRIGALLAAFGLAFLCIRRAAADCFDDAQDPNLVLYCAVVIVAVLGVFTLWALLSWIVTLAPLLSLRHGLGFPAALRSSVRPGRVLMSKLMEVNLVLGIVKLALLVLAMVFSAIPLPFESVTTPQQLHIWWAIVTVAYVVANELFQVVRLVATLELTDAYPVPAIR